MTDELENSGRKRVRIHIRGRIDPEWMTWFEGLEIDPDADETTILQGEVADQSALYGILARLRDLGIELLSVEQIS
ncbi:MAG: hypothetical protein P8X64_03630 [Anaerolineales bacterium]|jgi:hypothetical protein